MTKGERLKIFQERLLAAPAATNANNAYMLIGNILNAVEDEFSGVPNNPDAWMTDGRIYPPQHDRIRPEKGNLRILRLRSLAHETFLGDNGSIEIRIFGAEDVIFAKSGADGLHVKHLR